MKKNKIIFIIVSILFICNAYAQSPLTLTMGMASVQPQFAREVDTSADSLIVTGTSPVAVNFEFKVTIYGDGVLLGQSDLTSVPTYTWNPGDILVNLGPFDAALSSMRSNFGFRESILAGVTPIHSYQMTVSLVDPVTYSALTDSQTFYYSIQTYGGPTLGFPGNTDTVSNASFRVNFTWNKDTPAFQIPEYYKLTVVPIFSGQSAATAMSVNTPVLVADSITDSSYS